VIAGLDGIGRSYDPGPPESDPYTTEHTRLPASLAEALDLLQGDDLFRRQLGEIFMTYYLKLKRAELERFLSHRQTKGGSASMDEPSEWEQNEYFDFF
jgi:glutamine synthetase